MFAPRGSVASPSNGDGRTKQPTAGAQDHDACAALEMAVGRIAARWKPTILFHLATGSKRRAELDRLLPTAVNKKVLTAQLRRLVDDGLVVRTDHRAAGASRLRHVTYELSPAGEALRPVLGGLVAWSGSRHAAIRADDRPAQRGRERRARPVVNVAAVAASARRRERVRAWLRGAKCAPRAKLRARRAREESFTQ